MARISRANRVEAISVLRKTATISSSLIGSICCMVVREEAAPRVITVS
jgi:hypothetical protein